MGNKRKQKGNEKIRGLTKSDFHYQYQWSITDVSEYVGLSEDDKKWLAEFNLNEAGGTYRKDSTVPIAKRRESWRNNKRQQKDILNQKPVEIREDTIETNSPEESIIKILDQKKKSRKYQNH